MTTNNQYNQPDEETEDLTNTGEYLKPTDTDVDNDDEDIDIDNAHSDEIPDGDDVDLNRAE